MASKALPHGMGGFFKDCEHPRSRWPRCPHLYKIRYRDATQKQLEESGFTTQDDAIERLTEIYRAKKSQNRGKAKAERIKRYAPMRFADFAEEWRGEQRHLADSSLRHLDSLFTHHLLPAFESRRMSSFDFKVVNAFIVSMERDGVGLATQANAFDKLKAILLSAHRLGLYDDNPLESVKPPQYDPERAVIPSPAQLAGLRDAGDDAFALIADLMSGCGLRNGEAAAVRLDNIVADDTYRVHEQVNQTSNTYSRLKHRKVGEYRDVPLPARARQSIERYADIYGTIDGYLLRHPRNAAQPYPYYYLSNQWQRIKKSESVEVPDGMTVYGFRHFFASNCLSHNIPITDVAEWMGHRSLDITFRIYRHLMPGSISKAAKILDLGLAA
ncbi:tyrosine-type recombinase/integrase [Streptomyces sp. NPDC051569]|uniref:tyrosine-type recombinase/integrase n=1 Tax=Streptomyces sp. NPDC051569 TaxID=3365661 RepID=UPI003796ACCB